MLPRHSIERKHRPRFEALESKQLLSAGLLIAHEAQSLMQATAPVSSQTAHQPVVSPCGTGTGIVIITSG